MFWDKKDQKSVSDATIRTALGSPDWLSGVRISESGHVALIIEADPSDMERAETRRLEAEARIMSIDGVTDVKVVLTAERKRKIQIGRTISVILSYLLQNARASLPEVNTKGVRRHFQVINPKDSLAREVYSG